MKRILYILTFIFFGLFGVINEGWSEAFTFDKSDFSYIDISAEGNPISASKNGITILCNAGTIPSKNNWIVFKGGSNLVISSTLGNIISIDFTCTASDYTGNMINVSDISTTSWSRTVSCTGGKTTVRVSSIVVTYESTPSPPIPTTYDTITFRDIHNNKWTQKTTENNDTIFFNDTIPSEACGLNGWVFAGWSTDSLDETKIIKDSSYIIPTKNDTLYAFYKIISKESNSSIIDTIYASKLKATSTTYKEFDIIGASGASYYGNTARNGDAIQITNSKPTNNITPGIISKTSGGSLEKIKVIWNSSTASTRCIKIYQSDTAFASTNNLTNIRTDSIKYGTNVFVLNGKPYIGIRSKENALYIDTIYITWSTAGLGYEYSTNPKCFETNISVAEWHKDYVEFDVGNYDSIHTYNGQMNPCDSIRIKLVNENKEECIRWFHVPVFAGANTIIDNLDCDVVILKDSILTINSNISNNNVYVYPDGILHINKNKTYTVNSLILRRDNNDVPQFLYEGTLKVNNGMFFEMRTDAKDWRWLTLPDSIRVNEISDKSEVLLKYYDGKERAKNGKGGWKFLNKDSISGFGTIFGIDIDTDEKRIYKFRLDTNILSQEKSTDNKKIKIREFSSVRPKNDHGWNLVGNPFMSMYNVSDNFGVKFKADSLVKEIINGQWTGRWITEEKDLRYIVVPSDKQEQHIIDAGGYEQICLQNGYKLPPFTSFFVQAKETADLIFYHGQRVANVPSRTQTTNKNKESFLQINIGSIKTGCYISNKFNDSYEIGDDMESLYSTYQLINGYKLLYSAVNDSIVEHGIKFYTQSENLYLDDKTNIEDFDEIYAFYNDEWIDLLHGQTRNVSGEFILFAKRKTQVCIPTDIDIIKDNNEVIKFIHNNNLYIKKNNHIYNILGGILK